MGKAHRRIHIAWSSLYSMVSIRHWRENSLENVQYCMSGPIQLKTQEWLYYYGCKCRCPQNGRAFLLKLLNKDTHVPPERSVVPPFCVTGLQHVLSSKVTWRVWESIADDRRITSLTSSVQRGSILYLGNTRPHQSWVPCFPASSFHLSSGEMGLVTCPLSEEACDPNIF